MKDVVQIVTLPRQTVVDPCAGTPSPETSFVLPPRHRRDSGCHIHQMCFRKALEGVLEVFVRQVLDKNSDRISKADSQTVVKFLVSVIDGIGGRQKDLLLDSQR